MLTASVHAISECTDLLLVPKELVSRPPYLRSKHDLNKLCPVFAQVKLPRLPDFPRASEFPFEMPRSFPARLLLPPWREKGLHRQSRLSTTQHKVGILFAEQTRGSNGFTDGIKDLQVGSTGRIASKSRKTGGGADAGTMMVAAGAAAACTAAWGVLLAFGAVAMLLRSARGTTPMMSFRRRLGHGHRRWHMTASATGVLSAVAPGAMTATDYEDSVGGSKDVITRASTRIVVV